MYEAIFFTLWILNLLSYIYVKKLLKSTYPEIHDEIYAKSILEHSVKHSTRFIRFSFGGKQWNDISDSKVIFWLNINRVLNCAIYFGVLSVIAYILVGGILILLK